MTDCTGGVRRETKKRWEREMEERQKQRARDGWIERETEIDSDRERIF